MHADASWVKDAAYFSAGEKSKRFSFFYGIQTAELEGGRSSPYLRARCATFDNLRT